MNPGQYPLAYLGHVLPIISETFVVREIAELRRLGARIKVFCLHPPDDTVIHPEAPDLAREVEVLRQPSNPQFWLAHLFFLLRFPGRYLLQRYAVAAGARLRLVRNGVDPQRFPPPWFGSRYCLPWLSPWGG